jgi:hypothetical protein
MTPMHIACQSRPTFGQPKFRAMTAAVISGSICSLEEEKGSRRRTSVGIFVLSEEGLGVDIVRQ